MPQPTTPQHMVRDFLNFRLTGVDPVKTCHKVTADRRSYDTVVAGREVVIRLLNKLREPALGKYLC